MSSREALGGMRAGGSPPRWYADLEAAMQDAD